MFQSLKRVSSNDENAIGQTMPYMYVCARATYTVLASDTVVHVSDSGYEAIIREAFDTIEAQTMVSGTPCVMIRERTDQSDYIYIDTNAG